MEGVRKKYSFANSCGHRKDCCPLFFLSFYLCSQPSHFTLFQWMWHWLQEWIQLNCPTLPLILPDFFFYQVGDFKWLEWVSNWRQKIKKKLICVEVWGQTLFVMITRFGTIEVPLQQCPNTKSFLCWGLSRLSPQSNKCAETPLGLFWQHERHDCWRT